MTAQIEASVVEDTRSRLLDPVDRISEILFGLIMAVTFVGSISVATAGSEDVRTATASALGCNLAWGLVDAVMYVIRNVTARTRRRTLARRIVAASPETARDMIAKALPPGIADITGPRELEAMRDRLRAVPLPQSSVVTGRDFLEAVGVFLLVYVGMIVGKIPRLRIDRTGFALLGAIVLVATGRMTTASAWASIDVATIARERALACAAEFDHRDSRPVEGGFVLEHGQARPVGRKRRAARSELEHRDARLRARFLGPGRGGRGAHVGMGTRDRVCDRKISR